MTPLGACLVAVALGLAAPDGGDAAAHIRRDPAPSTGVAAVLAGTVRALGAIRAEARGLAKQESPGLVLDVGMNEGGDTLQYLRYGYRVVGVEANPQLVESDSKRFAREIQEGRLSIEGVGIAAENETGELQFWEHPSDVWGKLGSPHAKCFEGGKNLCTPVPVETTTCAKVLEKVGVPLYMKVDIEGNDLACLASLEPLAAAGDLCRLPRYASVEATGGAAGLAALETFRRLGYTMFKHVTQSQFNSRGPTWPAQASGPFGEYAEDLTTGVLWSDFDTMAARYKDGTIERIAGQSAQGEWMDLHARLPLAADACPPSA